MELDEAISVAQKAKHTFRAMEKIEEAISLIYEFKKQETEIKSRIEQLKSQAAHLEDASIKAKESHENMVKKQLEERERKSREIEDSSKAIRENRSEEIKELQKEKNSLIANIEQMKKEHSEFSAKRNMEISEYSRKIEILKSELANLKDKLAEIGGI